MGARYWLMVKTKLYPCAVKWYQIRINSFNKLYNSFKNKIKHWKTVLFSYKKVKNSISGNTLKGISFWMIISITMTKLYALGIHFWIRLYRIAGLKLTGRRTFTKCSQREAVYLSFSLGIWLGFYPKYPILYLISRPLLQHSF